MAARYHRLVVTQGKHHISALNSTAPVLMTRIAAGWRRVLVEQLGAVDAGRLGRLTGHLSPEEMWGVDEALITILGLR